MARATSDPEGQGSVKLIEAENKARTIAPAFCESYMVRTDTLSNPLPSPEEPPRIDTAQLIEAEKETRTVARVFTPTDTTRAAPLPVPAFTAVFETNELLEHILSYVQVEHRDAIRRVSRAWNMILLKLGSVLGPVDHRIFGNIKASYRIDEDIRYNPILVDTRVRGPAFGAPRMNLYFQPLVDEGGGVKLLDTTNRSIFLGREQEFITSPPITNVDLVMPSFDGDARGTMRVRDGIRVGQLVEVLNKMAVHALTKSEAKAKRPSDPYYDPPLDPMAYFTTRHPHPESDLPDRYLEHLIVTAPGVMPSQSKSVREPFPNLSTELRSAVEAMISSKTRSRCVMLSKSKPAREPFPDLSTELRTAVEAMSTSNTRSR
jgi:hypothetical protein